MPSRKKINPKLNVKIDTEAMIRFKNSLAEASKVIAEAALSMTDMAKATEGFRQQMLK